jgi:pSer/pThr/pTyr-binding forkhead associated (FHA) protein
MNARIRVLAGPLAEQIIPICGTKLIIGREEDCHVRPESEFISRHHCALLLDDYTLRVRDLGSKNGTFVNGCRIDAAETILLHDDVVAIGEMTFRIDLGQSPDGQDQAPLASPTMEGTGVFEGDTAKADAQPIVSPLIQPAASAAYRSTLRSS